MENFIGDIERSARKVFRLFLGSRLYRMKNCSPPEDEGFIGVDMEMQCNGRRRLSFYMDRKIIATLRERLGDSRGDETLDHDIIGEMANIITGSALPGGCDDIRLSPPEKGRSHAMLSDGDVLHFSSRMGQVYIAVEELA